MPRDTANSMDLEKQITDISDAHREESHDSSMAVDGGMPEKLAEEQDKLSRVESAASAVFDPASIVPTNASRESGIIGIYTPPYSACGKSPTDT